MFRVNPAWAWAWACDAMRSYYGARYPSARRCAPGKRLQCRAVCVCGAGTGWHGRAPDGGSQWQGRGSRYLQRRISAHVSKRRDARGHGPPEAVAQAIRCARLARFSTAFHVLPVAAWVRRPWLAGAAIHSDLAFSPLGRQAGERPSRLFSFAPFPSHGQINGLFDHHLNLQNLPIPLLPSL
jgi:hypothetical protein